MKTPQKAERRIWVRYPSEQEATYRPFGSTRGESFAARLLDVSATGMGLLSNYSFRPGTILDVSLEASGRSSRQILVRVRQSNAQADGSWLLGCVLITELSDQELAALTS